MEYSVKKFNYKLPLKRVKLPTLHQTQKYFESIDKNLIYSNNGPLVVQLKELLANKFELDVGFVTITSSGTMSLQTILLEIVNRRKGKSFSVEKKSNDLYCILPSFTFAASAMAIVGAGLQPIFVDIEGDSGQLTPNMVEKFLDKKIVDRSKVIAVMPVSPFGAKINKGPWAKFRSQHTIEIVYDEAWCFDSFKSDSIGASAISLHATKTFGCGEGGLILSKDTEKTKEYQSIINFGFKEGEVQFIGANGKMSEYSAAVGLALLDGWSQKKATCIRIQEYYLERLKSLSNIQVMEGFNNSWAWGALPILLTNGQNVRQIIREAGAQEIEFRSWWKSGVHAFSAMKEYPSDALDNTNTLTNKLINIPFFPEMSKKDVDLVCSFFEQFDV